MGQTLNITSTQATLTVHSRSTINPCSLTFILKVQPATGKGLASNHITKTGTSPAPGGGTSYGLLTIVAGAPKTLAYTVQPSASTTAGTAFATAPVLAVKDQFGNSVSKASVALSITPGTGPAGATLTCPTNPVIANSVGAATFTGCKIDMAGTYTLRASSGAASADSAPITVTGSPGNVGALPSVLAFTEGPGAPLGGKPFPTSVRVAIQNGGATRTSGISATVTLAIGNNPSGGVLTCTPDNTVGTIAGVATFTGCSIDKAGTGYTLTATASNVVPSGIIGTGTSGTFTVALPPPATGSPAPAPPPAPKSGTNGVTRTGNAKANVLVGTALADVLRGLGGNDRLSGNAGNDKLYGGPGRDILSGGAGADLLDAGTGNDTVNARDNVKDTIRCGPGKDTVTADKKDMVTRDCETVKRT
jgi:hypothetical protein